MRFTLAASAISALLVSTSVVASPVFTDTFDAENGGNSALVYGSFANFIVTRGTVDLVRNGDFGNLQCLGGAGSCVDLGGTGGSDQGQLTSRSSFAFNAGDTLTLTAQVSGNQRGGSDPNGDPVTLGFTFAGGISQSSTFAVAAAAPYAPLSYSFVAPGTGSFVFFIGDSDNDDYGALLDTVTLDISPATAAVPEPATWATMVGGFGLVGGALRRRVRAAALA